MIGGRRSARPGGDDPAHTRRRFLGVAGAGAVGVGAVVASTALAQTGGTPAESRQGASAPIGHDVAPPQEVRTVSPRVIRVAGPTGIAARDTAAIRRALGASTYRSPAVIVLGAGTYRINGELAIPFAPGTRIAGQGRGITTVEQLATGKPVFAFRHDMTHSVTIEDLTVSYAKRQRGAGAVAFLYHVAGGTESGFFHHAYRNLVIVNAAFGFKVADDDGKQTLWDTRWEGITFSQVALGLFSIAPAVAIGMPALTMRNIGSYNAPIRPDAIAFKFMACEVNMDGIDLEGWSNQAIQVTGGGYCLVRNLHVEHHVFSRTFSTLCSVSADTTLRVDGFTVHGASTRSNTDSVILFAPASRAALEIADGTVSVDASATGAYLKEVVWASPGETISIVVKNVRRAAGNLNLPGNGPRATETAAYVALSGGLRSGDAGFAASTFQLLVAGQLPSPGESRRGELRMVSGGDGQADRVFACLRSSSGGYAWRQIATG